MSLRRRNVLAARRRGGGGWDFRNGFILPTVSAVVLLVAAYLLIPVFKTREGDVKNPAGEPPFHIRVREAYAETIDGRSFVFPRRLPISSFAFLNLPLSKDPSKDVKALIKEREAQDDLRFAGLGGLRVGVHSSREARSASRYHLTLTGNRVQPVHIESLRARVVATKEAPAGTLLLAPAQGGGRTDVVYLDLDASRKDAIEVDDRGNPNGRIFADVQNRFAEEGEPLDFEVIAVTSRPVMYQWELVVEVTQDGKSEEMIIRRDGGTPFHTIGWIAVEKYGVVYGRGPFDKIVERSWRQ